MRVVVIGGDAAGMSAAHQALRTAHTHGREIEVVALEATGHTSYSACGIPYWIAGDVGAGDDLVARSAARHRQLGVDLRLGTRATAVDPEARTVTWQGPAGEGLLDYDELVVATGAHPIVPDWARRPGGSPYDGVGVVKNLDDGDAWLARMAERPGGRVVVVGAGYLGVEMAEVALRRGYDVTVVTRSTVMSNLDPDLGGRVADAMRAAGAEVVEHAVASGLETQEGRVAAVTVAVDHTVRAVPADLVVLALGVEPSTGFLDRVPLADSGALRPDPLGLVVPGIWGAGDCCEVVHRLTGEWVFLPLGTHANKQGRAVGENLVGGSLRFDGALGTAITRFAGGGEYVEIARTGLSTHEAAAAGLDSVSLVTEGTTASGYMPEAAPIAIKVLAERGTRRLLGAQIVGGAGAGKRIDAFATALWAGLRVEDFAWADLSYAPPFATAWEVTQVAARRVAERL